jgi:hypothetical protein
MWRRPKSLSPTIDGGRAASAHHEPASAARNRSGGLTHLDRLCFASWPGPMRKFARISLREQIAFDPELWDVSFGLKG